MLILATNYFGVVYGGVLTRFRQIRQFVSELVQALSGEQPFLIGFTRQICSLNF